MVTKEKSRAERLKQVSMPKKPMAQDEADTDLEALGSPEDSESPDDEANESPSQQSLEDHLGTEQHDSEHALALISDDDLLAELKKRGLMSQSSPVGKAAESDMVDDSAISKQAAPQR